MTIEHLKQQLKTRPIFAALIIAGGIIGASLVQAQGTESVGTVWLATAVYMLGILISAMIMLPLVEHKGWLFGTATLLALSIVFPAAILNSSHWATEQLSQLGTSASSLFFILVISTIEQPEKYANKRWIITSVYFLIMLVLTILL